MEGEGPPDLNPHLDAMIEAGQEADALAEREAQVAWAERELQGFIDNYQSYTYGVYPYRKRPAEITAQGGLRRRRYLHQLDPRYDIMVEEGELTTPEGTSWVDEPTPQIGIGLHPDDRVDYSPIYDYEHRASPITAPNFGPVFGPRPGRRHVPSLQQLALAAAQKNGDWGFSGQDVIHQSMGLPHPGNMNLRQRQSVVRPRPLGLGWSSRTRDTNPDGSQRDLRHHYLTLYDQRGGETVVYYHWDGAEFMGLGADGDEEDDYYSTRQGEGLEDMDPRTRSRQLGRCTIS